MVLEQLEGKPKSPSSGRGDSPVVPVRSMLDVSSGPVPRHGSIAGIGVGITDGARGPQSPQSPQYRSMLDITSPITSPTPQPAASLPSPPVSQAQQQQQRRSSVDSTSKAAEGLPKALAVTTQVRNKAKDCGPTTAMAAAISGDLDSLPGFGRTREGRHNSTVGIGAKSRSPSSRLAPRSQSPSTNVLGANMPAAPMPSNAYVTNSGKVVDMDKAYRKLSERSHGSSSFSTEGENVRVHKDPVDEEDEEAVESSDDDEPSTDEDEITSEASRGRRRSRRKKGSSGSEVDRDDSEGGSESTPLGMGQAHGPREAKTLMAAAEEERKSTPWTALKVEILISSQARRYHHTTPSNLYWSPKYL